MGGKPMATSVAEREAMTAARKRADRRRKIGEEPVAVTARESTDRRDPRFAEMEDMMDRTLESPSGTIANRRSIYRSARNHVLPMDDRGRIELEPATRYDGDRSWTGADGRERAVTPRSGPAASQFAGRLGHLARCVAAGREPIVSGEEGLCDMRIVEAIHRSVRERRTFRPSPDRRS